MKAFPTLALIYAPLFALLGLWIWLRGGTCDGDGTARLETYWEPEFVLAATEPAQDRLIGKLGGLPWGFPASRWPVCGECDHALSHIAQLPHVPQVFELGKRGRVLHLFHCEVDGSCSTWDDSTGAGAWVLLGKTELGKGLTRPPEGTEVLGEYWIKGWDKRTTPRAIIQNLDAWNDYRRFFTLDDDITDEAFAVRHKAGGVPY